MSIKLYEGYQIVGDVADSLSAQRGWLIELRRQIKHSVRCQALSDAVSLAVQVVDIRVVWPESEALSKIKEVLKVKEEKTSVIPYIDAIQYYRERDQEDKSYQCNVVFLRSQTKTLALFYGEDVFRKIWELYPQVQPYGYWNNTDMPDDVTEEEWDKRHQDWSEAFSGSSSWVPSEAGWSVNLAEGQPWLPLDEETMAFVPTREQRARYQAKWLILDQLQQELDVTAKIKAEQSYSAYFEMVDRFNTAEYQQEWSTETARIEKLLPDVTREMLIENIL